MRRRDVFAALFAACACYAASKRASHARFEPFVRFDAIDASSVIASPRHTARALPTPAFDGERGFVFFARGVNATTIARATLAEDDGDASAKISRRRVLAAKRGRRRRRRRRVTHARDEDDAVRARGMRVLAETAVGREMDGFEEVDADDGASALSDRRRGIEHLCGGESAGATNAPSSSRAARSPMDDASSSS